jgi:hypothetical protein
MTKFNIDREREKVERELSELGAKLSEPFIARAKELIIQLSGFKGVKLERLVMGMGGWSLVGTIPFKEIWSGGVEEGDHEIQLAIHFDTGRSGWLEHYENVNPGITAVGMELNRILETLTNETYLQIFDITDAEMKKLLKRKT